MPSHVYANGRSVIHAGDKLVLVAATPDVCKTPSPGGPVPVPYPNIARTADLTKGSRKVKIKGNAVAIEGSKLRMSTGDEAGSAGGGVISSKIKGALTWGACSHDVRVEGKGVLRFLDPTLHNGNGANDNGISAGASYMMKAEDTERDCLHCGRPFEEHDFPELRADPEAYISAQGDYVKNNGVHLIGGLHGPGGFVATANAGGSGQLTRVFNFKTGRQIDIPRDFSQAGRDRNPVGNCAEQKLLTQLWEANGGNFPFGQALAIGVGPRVNPHNNNWNKPKWQKKKFKKGDAFAAPCNTCREIMMAMLCQNPPK